MADHDSSSSNKMSQADMILQNPLYIFFHKDARISKLKTKEDPLHIHKTLGILSVCSFIYRYAYVYNQLGNLGFDGDWFDWATMVLHTLLAFSSIIFRVPSKRIDKKPMIIYEEYRQHAMVFTHRCFAVYAAAILWEFFYPGQNRPFVLIPLIVCAHHVLVDDITRRHGSGNTAVRAQSKKLKTSSFYKRVGYLYSFYQFLALASHLSPSDRVADCGYNAIIAIQSSAFMMTLYRKRIIRGRTHMVIYSACLVVSAYHAINILGAGMTFLSMLTFMGRINFPRKYSTGLDKYILWTIYLLAVAYVLPTMPSFGEIKIPAKLSFGTVAGLMAQARGKLF